MLRLTKEQEIHVLQQARLEVERGRPHVCVLIKETVKAPTLNVVKDMTTLIDEIGEFLDGEVCVEDWLKIPARYGVVEQYRLAIIDTLLARRGVF